MTNSTCVQSAVWDSTPLCARYLVVLFNAVQAPVMESNTTGTLPIHWSLGALGDGGCEVLGAWPESMTGVTPWQQILDDLEVRGVERIRFVSAADSAEMRATYRGTPMHPCLRHLARSVASASSRERVPAAAMRALRTAGTVRAAGETLTELSTSPWGAKHPASVECLRAALTQLAPFYALPRHLRRVVLSAEDTAEQVLNSLNRAIARHGQFADRNAAASFVVKALKHAEGRFGNGLASRPLPSTHRAVRVDDRARPGALSF